MEQVYSLQHLFQLIDQPKNPHEFYSEYSGDFGIERQKSIGDVLEFMYSANGIQNEFWGDIGIIYKNQRKNVMCKLRQVIS